MAETVAAGIGTDELFRLFESVRVGPTAVCTWDQFSLEVGGQVLSKKRHDFIGLCRCITERVERSGKV